MKQSHFVILSALLFYTVSCAGKDRSNTQEDNYSQDTNLAVDLPDSFATGRVITLIAKEDPSQSYALYIPSKGNKEALPAIYFFDPHADGSLPVNKYQALADTYNFILIGSNNSKNGNDWSTTEKIWNTLHNDSRKRLKINTDRLYTCGFSGGAKVASYVALNHNNIKGVIAGGAALPDGTAPRNFKFSFTAIAGEGDMNMTDLVAITNDFDKTSTPHRIIFFGGKHEWAPENIMNIAFAGLQMDAMREKIIQKDDAFISNYVIASKKRMNDDIAANNLINAERECTLSINMLNGLTEEVNWFKEKDASLVKSTAYKKELQQQQNLFHTEQILKADYVQQFQQGDMNYWTKTITDLQTRAKAKTPEGSMYQRLAAYLSLAFYSISNQLMNSNQNEAAQYFVQLYKLDDPTNSEAWYFSAVLNARNNNAQAAESDLLKAVENGFNDEERMEQQPEFQSLSTQINFPKIEAVMKKK